MQNNISTHEYNSIYEHLSMHEHVNVRFGMMHLLPISVRREFFTSQKNIVTVL